MKQIVINKENIVKTVKNYLYTLCTVRKKLCTVRKKLFRITSGQTTYYNKGFGIVPSGNQWYTEIVILGLSFKIINRTVHY